MPNETPQSFIAIVANGFFQELYPFSARLLDDEKLQVWAYSSAPHSEENSEEKMLIRSERYLLFGPGFSESVMYSGYSGRNHGTPVKIQQRFPTEGIEYWEIQKLPADQLSANRPLEVFAWSLDISRNPPGVGEIPLIKRDGFPGQYFSLVPYNPRLY